MSTSSGGAPRGVPLRFDPNAYDAGIPALASNIPEQPGFYLRWDTLQGEASDPLDTPAICNAVRTHFTALQDNDIRLPFDPALSSHFIAKDPDRVISSSKHMLDFLGTLRFRQKSPDQAAGYLALSPLISELHII
jgi:hypothetical protein